MSNLNLPPLTYPTLRGKLWNGTSFRPVVKLAYETTAEITVQGNVVIRHHGSPIAEIGRDHFTLDNAGWNSRTTADRLNAILRDNQTPLPSADSGFTDRLWYFAACRQGQVGIWGRPVEGKDRLLRVLDHSVAHFSRTSSDAHYVLEGGDEYL